MSQSRPTTADNLVDSTSIIICLFVTRAGPGSSSAEGETSMVASVRQNLSYPHPTGEPHNQPDDANWRRHPPHTAYSPAGALPRVGPDQAHVSYGKKTPGA
jgi:hypothetical protein